MERMSGSDVRSVVSVGDDIRCEPMFFTCNAASCSVRGGVKDL